MRRILIPVLIVLSACSGLEELSKNEHVVAAPISRRANVVLQSLVHDYGARSGDWGGCMSDGCVQIWATQFGYRAGLRRDRKDLVELGRRTASRQASAVRGLAWRALFGGDVHADDPAVFGFPALLVSGALGGRDFDGFLFEKVLEEAVARASTLDERGNAGLAAILAESAALRPDERGERLALARERAEAARGGGGETWRFLAWSTIARVTREEQDAERARAVLDETSFRFNEHGTLLLPLDASEEVLSRILSLAHGLIDLTQATGDRNLHRRAVSVLDYVFSDAYFDGRLLIHDRVHGPSEDVCSGCNFEALYLVDRLYGDTFVIDPLPVLPERPRTPPRTGPDVDAWETVLVLEPGNGPVPARTSMTLRGIDTEDGLVLQHGREPVWIELCYRIVYPLIEVDVKSFFGSEVGYSISAGFSEEGTAKLLLGSDPLNALLTFQRLEDGRYALEIVLTERAPR